jgi:hypothetical protein
VTIEINNEIANDLLSVSSQWKSAEIVVPEPVFLLGGFFSAVLGPISKGMWWH